MSRFARHDPDVPLPPWAGEYLAAFDRHLAGDVTARAEMDEVARREGLSGSFAEVAASLRPAQPERST